MALKKDTQVTRVILLCEDKQQEVFISRVLEELGLGVKNRFRTVSQKGQGGFTHVLQNIEAELKAYMQNKNHQSSALIVMIDADNKTYDERFKELENNAETAKYQLILNDKQEAIAVLIPRRNIETWIHYLLDGNNVDEAIKYPKLKKPSDCQPAVKRWTEILTQNPKPVNLPDSLARACPEVKRILDSVAC